MSLAAMTLPELEAHGRALADRLNNPEPHVCVNADTCARFEADQAAVIADLTAARQAWTARTRRSAA